MSEPRYQIGKFADSDRQWASGTVSELDTLREQLARVTEERDLAVRLVDELGLRARDRIAELKRFNTALAERCAAQAELLSNRAMRGGGL